jgi:uncharacterized protein (DUF2062 family)
MNAVSRYFSNKVVQPLLQQVRQGASPTKLAWSVSLGATCGLFPILGMTTLLSAAVGTIFRLNHVAMQTANYLAYAPQLALIPFFIRMGEKITGAAPMAIDLSVMKYRFSESPSLFLQDFGLAAWHGVLAWLVLMSIPTWIFANVLERAFKRLSTRAQSASNSP